MSPNWVSAGKRKKNSDNLERLRISTAIWKKTELAYYSSFKNILQTVLGSPLILQTSLTIKERGKNYKPLEVSCSQKHQKKVSFTSGTYEFPL